MRVPLGWLSEWIPLPPNREELEARLTQGGVEIEAVLHTGPDLAALRVGLVVERAPHPGADRLSLCRVDVGEGEPLDIVCGAPNVAAGQKVVVALQGAVLPDGSKIKRSKIRGIRSNGMICSARELGLGEDHEGILVLEANAVPGTPLPEVLRVGETVLDVEITPNRGDWVSMLGMAREVRAHFGGELRWPETAPKESGPRVSDAFSVEIADPQGCHHYAARLVRGVRVGPSPAWLRDRLEAAGLRSVNNIVDVTNLVMLEFGQPLHAFDLQKLNGTTLCARSASPGEGIRTLDGQERRLEPEDLVIADAAGVVAIAGVMGGAGSEVDAGSQDLLLESAHFSAPRVRRTSKRLGLRSDASYRFERGVDPDGQLRALDRAARLVQELAGGEVPEGALEARGEPVVRTEQIPLEVPRLNRLLGTRLGDEEVVRLLARVDVASETRGPGVLSCRPPRYRGDLHLPADLAEEVARIHGYDQIPATLPGGARSEPHLPPSRATREAVRTALVGAGLTEIMTFPGARAEDADALRLATADPRRRALPVLNPIQTGEAWLRTMLLPSALRAVRSNRNRQVDPIRLFEISRVFRIRRPGELPEEPLQAAVVLCETTQPGLWESRAPLFFQIKGIAERVLLALGQDGVFRAGSEEAFLHPGACGSLQVAGKRVAVLGELHPETAGAFEIDVPTTVLMLDVEALAALPAAVPRYREVSRHPRVLRDLSVLLERDVPAEEVLQAIRKRAGASLGRVTLFDRYEGKGVPEGKVSLAFRLVFQHSDRTLTEPEVAKATARVVKLLSSQFGGELR